MIYHYAERSPDPFDGRKPFPWWRVMRGGSEHPMVDFLPNSVIASRVARELNIDKHAKVAK